MRRPPPLWIPSPRWIPSATCALLLVGTAACRGPLHDGRAGELESASPSGRSEWSAVGRSREGRELEAATFGNGPTRVYWIGGIHGDEPEGGRELEALLELFAEPRISSRYTVRVLRDANPDGTAAGTRESSSGIDLNRNLPAASFRPGAKRGPEPLSEPETRALWLDLERFTPDLVVVLHSARGGPFANHDGPASAWAERFVQGARVPDPRWRVVADMGYPTPGSLGSAIGVDRGIPILTLEMRSGDPPERVRPGLVAGTAALLGAPPPAWWEGEAGR